MMCETGDIYLVRTKSWLGKLIRFWTRGRHSHAGIIVRSFDNQILGIEASWTGVTPVSVTEKYKNADIIFLTPVKPLDKTEKLALQKFLFPKLYDDYDWFGILGFLTFKRWQNPVKWYCFELVYHAYAHIGRSLGRLDNDYIDGRLIYFSNELKFRGPK